MKIEIGMPYSFRPAAFLEMRKDGIWQTPVLHGKIIYINRAHGYFTAEATVHGRTLRESFPCAPVSRIARHLQAKHGYRH